jgi:vacuolar-type H+-ATPase subunit B/Vma2
MNGSVPIDVANEARNHKMRAVDTEATFQSEYFEGIGSVRRQVLICDKAVDPSMQTHMGCESMVTTVASGTGAVHIAVIEVLKA